LCHVGHKTKPLLSGFTILVLYTVVFGGCMLCTTNMYVLFITLKNILITGIIIMHT